MRILSVIGSFYLKSASGKTTVISEVVKRLEKEHEIKMNILMTLSNPFTHDPRVYNEAKSLVKAGHKVTILSWDRSKKNPLKEVKDGINVVRIRNTKFMDFLLYDIFRLHFLWNEGYKKALELHKENPFDVVHCHDLDTLPIGAKLKKKLGLPLVYDAHEIWGYMVARDLPKWWANYYLWKEKNLIMRVDKIITVNEPLKNYFGTIENKPITIIMNCKPLQGTKYEPPNNDKFTLLYIGILGKPRFLLELVDVVKELPDIHCIIGGMGKPEYVNALKDKCFKAQNVDFIGRVPFEEVLPMTKKADVVVCMINPCDLNNSIALANKQFEAMVCGRPIICTKDTYVGKFTEKEKCGLIVPYTKKDLKNAIIELRDNPELREELGRNTLKAAIREYNWEKQEEKLLRVFEELM
jgi:glycosyltransferase involved in cell wall biosynthesis